MSSREPGLGEVFAVAPGGVLVVEGAGLEAAVQDADEPVGDAPQGVVVLQSAVAEPVIVSTGTGRGVQGGERLGVERVDEPVVVHEPGGYDLPLPGGPGDRAGGGVVPAGLAVGVAARVIAEFCEHPGAEDGSQAGLGQVDLSVRVPPKMVPHLPFKSGDLLI